MTKLYHSFLLFLSAAVFVLPELKAQVVINEYSCANLSQFEDSYMEHEDWIELYNTSSSDSAHIQGWYLSDDDDEPTKFLIPNHNSLVIPPNGFLRVWCSGRNGFFAGALHTSFKLTQTKNKAEHLILADPTGTAVQDVKVEKTQISQSRCRMTDGAAEWRICSTPTPYSSNNGSTQFTGFADRPDFDQNAGFYQDQVTVTISTNEPGGQIYYTTDGSEPSQNSTLYSGPIDITQTTVLKARTYSPDDQVFPSYVQFGTYFINVDHSLVVISVGSGGVLELANGNQSLRPDGSIEYFGKDKLRKARTYGSLNSHGQDSWVNDQRSLDWVSHDEMGYNAVLKEKIFQLSPREEFQRLILRAAGDDNFPDASGTSGSAHVRDAYVHNLADRGKLNVDLRRSEKAIVYLNGQYWGVYDLREIPDDHDYTDYYYGQSKYEIQYILTWGNTWAEYGGNTALTNYNTLRAYIQNNNMADPAKYQYVADRMDMSSLVDYVLTNSFTVCSDWLNYNTGWWRGLNPEGEHKKWGFILWDNDATFGHYINYTGIPNTSPSAAPCDPEGLTASWPDVNYHIRNLNKLRANPEFNQYYITRQADLMQTVFGCDNMISYLDSIISIIQPEMQQHCDRWDGDYGTWMDNVQTMRNFILDRCELLPDGLADCYSLNGPYPTLVKTDPPSSGQLKINTLDFVPGPVTNTYFGGIGTRLEAKPDSGFVFSHWSASNHSFADSSLAVVLLNLTTADTLIAHFKPAGSVGVTNPEASVGATAIAYPTLFEQSITSEFYLPQGADVSFKLINATGREITTFYQGEFSSGPHTLQFQAPELPAGVYFLQFSAGSKRQVMKLIHY